MASRVCGHVAHTIRTKTTDKTFKSDTPCSMGGVEDDSASEQRMPGPSLEADLQSNCLNGTTAGDAPGAATF